MLNFLSTYWIWLLFLGVVVFMHLGHRGDDGHGTRQQGAAGRSYRLGHQRAHTHAAPRLLAASSTMTTMTSTDPVCGMTVEDFPTAPRTTQAGRTFVFCNSACQARFIADPGIYAGPGGEPGAVVPKLARSGGR